MTHAPYGVRHALAILLVAALGTGCGGEREPDAFGNFEATEVVVSAETSGQLEVFLPTEGMRLGRGAVAAVVDTTDLVLERRQIVAQQEASGYRGVEASEQLAVLQAQLEIAQRAYERTQRLFAARAATAPQLDQAERDYRTLRARLDAASAQQQSIEKESRAAAAHVARIEERIARSIVRNPQPGTVLTTYASAGEVVQPGQPLYRIAGLDTLNLRAYVTGDQLPRVRIGQAATVHVDAGNGDLAALPGIVTWISASAEFTPTPIQTRDERGDLVYAVKVRVPNPDGLLKIGMPADVTFDDVGARGRGGAVDSAPVPASTTGEDA